MLGTVDCLRREEKKAISGIGFVCSDSLHGLFPLAPEEDFHRRRLAHLSFALSGCGRCTDCSASEAKRELSEEKCLSSRNEKAGA
jgi:hypothetical protein